MKKKLLLSVFVLISVLSFSQIPWETAFIDDFNRADGGMGSDYDAQAMNGTLLIENNFVKATPDGVSTMYWAATLAETFDNENIKLSIDFKATTNNPEEETKYAIMAKGGGSTVWSYGAGINANDSKISISKFDQTGNQNTLVESPMDIVADSMYHLEFTILGEDLSLTVTELYSGDEVTVIFTDPAPLDGSQISINGMQDLNEIVCFDNFQVDTVADNFSVNEINPLVNQISISPNPASDMLNLMFEYPKLETIDIQIFSIDGKMIYNEQHLSAKEIAIPVNDFKSGIYVVSIKGAQCSESLRFIKR